VFAEGESIGVGGMPFVPRSRLVFCDEHKNDDRTTDLINGKGWSAMTLGAINEPTTAPPVRADHDG
jgi:hypothetical protein